jgi:hypothetical protein
MIMISPQPLTILAMPKPFQGHIGIIQRNAIMSWTKLQPRPEIILFGYEHGVAECARELGLNHIPEVARNQHGTPLLADIFRQADQHARHDVLAYVNADIILPQEFIPGVEKVRQRFPSFLAVGRRTNINVREALDFSPGWENELRDRRVHEGQLESHTGIDFFVFRRGTFERVPPLTIGRIWFDQWCIKYACKKGLPVIDLTSFAPIVHQLHDYNHVPGGKQGGVYGGPEADQNLVYYDEKPHTYTILSASHVMTEDGRIRRVFFRPQALSFRRFFWEIFVNKTYPIRKRMGLSGGTRV